MSTLRLALLVLGPTMAVVAASCSPVVRPDPVASGGAGGGGSSTTLSGVQTSGTDATTGSGMPSTSSGPCADTLTNPANCGACGHDCSLLPNPGTATCENGVCAFTCSGGYLDCNPGAEDGCETDGANDPKNCNGCGSVCGLTRTCAASSCTDSFTSCAGVGTCTDPACEEPTRYSVNAELAVDITNGRRLWQRFSKGPLDYVQATDYCANATFGGVSGWRIPDGKELGSIVFNAGGLMGCGAGYCNPATDQAVFNDTTADEYWTMDPYMLDSHYCVSFCDGRYSPYKELDTSLHLVRCVHDPLP